MPRVLTAVVCAAFDAETDAAVARLRARLPDHDVRVPASPAHRPHFTLSAARVHEDDLPKLLAVAAEVAARHAPVPVALTEVGTFPRAGVLWLGPVASRGLPDLQRDVYRSLKQGGWPPAFGPQSAPRRWVAHCTLATRVPQPVLRAAERALRPGFEPITARVEALATIMVGGRGDVGLAPLVG